MTTIASDGRTIAADRQSTTGWGQITQQDISKLRVAHGRIYAFSGSAALFGPAVEWHAGGADPKTLPVLSGDTTWSLAVIESVGAPVQFYSNAAPYPDLRNYPFAMGSGQDYALGAMDHGASAAEAVAIAIRRDMNTGGGVDVVDIAAALAPPVAVAAE